MASKIAKLVPLLDRVLIEKARARLSLCSSCSPARPPLPRSPSAQVAAKTKTVGGILLPESASSKARAAAARLIRHCRSPTH
jgi:hypothetical protein